MSSHITNRLSPKAIGKPGSAFKFIGDNIVRVRVVRKKQPNGRVINKGVRWMFKGRVEGQYTEFEQRTKTYHVTKGVKTSAVTT